MIPDGTIALNPSTGQKIVSRGGKWMPFSSGPPAGPSPMPTAAPPPAAQPQPHGPPSLGQRINQDYSQYIANPASQAVAGALSDIGQRVQNPQQALGGLGDPMQYMQEALRPHQSGQVAPWAQAGAEMIVPQTPTAAALDVASLGLPQVGAARIAEGAGEAAGPISRLLGSRLGRVVGGTAVGAGAGELTGEGAGKGAAEGFGAFAPAEALGAGLAGALNKPAERLAQRMDATSVGKAISGVLPWVGKLEKPGDFENAFMKGEDSGVIQAATSRLHSVRDTIAQRVKGHTFLVPTPAGYSSLGAIAGGAIPKGGMQRLSFREATKLATDLDKGFGFTLGDQQRGGYTSREARALAYQIREHLANGLNLAKKGLGEAFRKSNREYDAARTLTRMFGPEGLVTPQGLSQPEMLARLRGQKEGRLLYDLDRSMGRGTRDRLIKMLGGMAGAKDVPSTTGHHHWMGHAIGAAMGAAGGEALGHPGLGAALGGLAGFMIPAGGQAFNPSRAIPMSRFSGTPFEMGISNMIGEQLKPADGTTGSAVKALDTSRAEHLAPTPSASQRAEKVQEDFGKGKIPEIHKDLNRGRLSLDETNKLVQYASAGDNSAIVQGMPLSELLDALEQANSEERQMLLPLVKQRLMAELPKQQNKTLQSNLSQRFQRIQQTPPAADKEAMV